MAMTTHKKTSTATKRARNLLIELGTEELPPKALKQLGEWFAQSMFEFLVDAGVVNQGDNNYQSFASPRRLAVWVKRVAPRQADKIEQRQGPALKAAYDQSGNPTAAAQGFANACGVRVEQLQQQQTDKGIRLVCRQKVSGEKIQALVATALAHAIQKLPIPKRMRWGDSPHEFVRPVHWLLVMYGSNALPVSVLGLKSDCWSIGHRFHAPGKLRIISADRYANTLKADGYVVADYAQRKALVEKQVLRIARRINATAVIAPDLLHEVTGLVEWPQALYGEFDKKYLAIPAEVLVASMRDHQKYFHLVDQNGALLPGFIAVSNIKSRSPKRVRLGNERVLRARLADAEFFWQSDQKVALIDRKPALARVLFHQKLGSIFDKVERIRGLAAQIGSDLGANLRHIDRSCDLCKTDLVTDMVGEMPALQGLIGAHYAANQGQPKAVCAAIEQHYWPRFAADRLPDNAISRAVALADRIDSVVGLFASGEAPTGDKDPYGLRRAALGMLRIMIEGRLELDLHALIAAAMQRYQQSQFEHLDTSEDAVNRVFDFIVERLPAYYQHAGYPSAAIAAVLAVKPSSPVDFDRRLQAVTNFVQAQPEAARALAAANKRIANILSKQVGDVATGVSAELFSEKAEVALATKLATVGGKASNSFGQGKYSKGLLELAKLKTAIDKFFDAVMVMDQDLKVRANRLALLQQIRALFLAVADISQLRIE